MEGGERLIQKRFPADITLKEITFLNDKKIDAELYAIFQSYSQSEDGITFVNKWDLPQQKVLANKENGILPYSSPKTYRAHLKYLIDAGYIIEERDRYILPKIENIYMLLPLETLRFLEDVFKDEVIKIYIYLGQKWKNSVDKEFTYNEIAQHIGLKLTGNVRGYEQIRNSLKVLSNCKLIEVSEEFFIGKGQSHHKLLKWTDDLKG